MILNQTQKEILDALADHGQTSLKLYTLVDAPQEEIDDALTALAREERIAMLGAYWVRVEPRGDAER